jgi:hypothetical protein
MGANARYLEASIKDIQKYPNSTPSEYRRVFLWVFVVGFCGLAIECDGS